MHKKQYCATVKPKCIPIKYHLQINLQIILLQHSSLKSFANKTLPTNPYPRVLVSEQKPTQAPTQKQIQFNFNLGYNFYYSNTVS